MITVDIQYATESKTLPTAAELRLWVEQALNDYAKDTAVTLRIVDIAEMTQLNLYYRGKNKPTNVLSFPYEENFAEEKLLGDIVICAPVVLAEAQEQQKPWQAHWAHLVVHGCLHLVGFDHEEENQAQIMESLEVKLLAGLGFPDPYT
jgi:probable rRNA maturation factor